VKLQLEHPALASCYDVAARGIEVRGDLAGQPTLRLISSSSAAPRGGVSGAELADEPVAEVWGFSLYAKQVVDGQNRQQLERLCRYLTHPPVAQDRLTRRADRSLQLELKTPWKDGTRAWVLSPDDLLVRLCAAGEGVPGAWLRHARRRAGSSPTTRVSPHARSTQLLLRASTCLGVRATRSPAGRAWRAVYRARVRGQAYEVPRADALGRGRHRALRSGSVDGKRGARAQARTAAGETSCPARAAAAAF
jgi:hypothetical protein